MVAKKKSSRVNRGVGNSKNALTSSKSTLNGLSDSSLDKVFNKALTLPPRLGGQLASDAAKEGIKRGRKVR